MSLEKVLFCIAPRGALLLVVVPKVACFVLFKALNLTICMLCPPAESVLVIAAAVAVEAEATEALVEVGVAGSRLLVLKELFEKDVLLAPRLNFFFLLAGGGSPRSSRSLKLTWLAKE